MAGEVAWEVADSFRRLIAEQAAVVASVTSGGITVNVGEIDRAAHECARLAGRIIEDHAELARLDPAAADDLGGVFQYACDLLCPPPATRRKALYRDGATGRARHHAARKLAGSWLARGVATASARNLLVDWDERCNRPPLGGAEVRRIVDDIATREARKPRRRR